VNIEIGKSGIGRISVGSNTVIGEIVKRIGIGALIDQPGSTTRRVIGDLETSYIDIGAARCSKDVSRTIGPIDLRLR
jgi:hypothetical protein